mmetsp:Transcript_937/g.1971  ORF Transcript_937/g.1971 Transcript_937/m.1971 type:complete len:81 (-) Transcript_937:132-374(-)
MGGAGGPGASRRVRRWVRLERGRAGSAAGSRPRDEYADPRSEDAGPRRRPYGAGAASQRAASSEFGAQASTVASPRGRRQ